MVNVDHICMIVGFLVVFFLSKEHLILTFILEYIDYHHDHMELFDKTSITLEQHLIRTLLYTFVLLHSWYISNYI